MTHYTHVLNGIRAFAESDILPKMSGSWRGWLLGAGVEVALDRAAQIYIALKDNAIIKASGVVDGENIEVDYLYGVLRKQADKSPATFAVPLIGSITLNAADIDTIYRNIKASGG